jgi:hypothetical protein
MVIFLYKEGQPVKEKLTEKVGTVVSCSTTEGTTIVPFYRVKFADGTVRPIAENELWPAQ